MLTSGSTYHCPESEYESVALGKELERKLVTIIVVEGSVESVVTFFATPELPQTTERQLYSVISFFKDNSGL